MRITYFVGFMAMMVYFAIPSMADTNSIKTIIAVVKSVPGNENIASIHVMLDLINASDNSLEIVTGKAGTFFTTKVYNKAGVDLNNVYRIPVKKNRSNPERHIIFSPHEKKSYQINLREFNDADGKPFKVPAGNYRVSVIVPTLSYTAGQYKGMIIQSNEISVIVTSEKKIRGQTKKYNLP